MQDNQVENPHTLLEASIKTAQYLSSLTTKQDVWLEIQKIMMNFFSVDLVMFAELPSDNKLKIHHWDFSKSSYRKIFSFPDQKTPSLQLPATKIGKLLNEGIEEVFETSFVSWRIVDTPTPFSLTFFPINQEHQVTAIMIVGHAHRKNYSRQMLGVYLSVAGLIGTTISRLSSEVELKQHRHHLEKLVNKRTLELENANARLHQEMLDRKRAEDQLNRLQKTKSLSRMAGAIAHHYNNFLSVIIGNLESALLDIHPNAGFSQEIQDAKKAAIQASEMGNLMLSYIGHSYREAHAVNLADSIREIVSNLSSNLPPNISLEVDLPPSGPMFHTNSQQFKQIIQILLVNAIESMENQEDKIRLSLTVISSNLAIPGYRFPPNFKPQSQTYVKLEIVDQGYGIPKSAIQQLCEPFFTTKSTGRGLGLPVVLGYVKTHAGCLSVESTEGKGSKFRVFLPLSFTRKKK